MKLLFHKEIVKCTLPCCLAEELLFWGSPQLRDFWVQGFFFKLIMNFMSLIITIYLTIIKFPFENCN